MLKQPDKQKLARCCCEMSASASRTDNTDRSLARSAWNSATQKCRPVGYGVIRAGVRTDSMIGVTKFRIQKLKRKQKHGAHVDEKYLWISCARSYRTLRDGSFEGRFPRHFVPGYDQPVPPGQKPFAHRRASHSVCTYVVKTLGVTLWPFC